MKDSGKGGKREEHINTNIHTAHSRMEEQKAKGTRTDLLTNTQGPYQMLENQNSLM